VRRASRCAWIGKLGTIFPPAWPLPEWAAHSPDVKPRADFGADAGKNPHVRPPARVSGLFITTTYSNTASSSKGN